MNSTGAPKFSPFMFVGGGASAVTTFVLTALIPVDQSVGASPLHGIFVVVGVTVGVTIGAVIALVSDWWADRHVTAEDMQLLYREEGSGFDGELRAQGQH